MSRAAQRFGDGCEWVHRFGGAHPWLFYLLFVVAWFLAPYPWDWLAVGAYVGWWVGGIGGLRHGISATIEDAQRELARIEAESEEQRAAAPWN